MSLFGTGRRESVLAVVLLVCTALFAHALGIATGFHDGVAGDLELAAAMGRAHELLLQDELPLWDPVGLGAPIWAREGHLLYPPWWLLGRAQDAFWLPALTALHAGLACALAFRFLRAQGRSRYAAFVGGAAYGLGAHVGSLCANLSELAALAWAPLPLEIVLRTVRGQQRQHTVALLGPTLALVFFTGGVVTASFVAAMAATALQLTARREPLRRTYLVGLGITSLAITALLTSPLWLGVLETPPRLPHQPDYATPVAELLLPLQRVLGPLLLFLCVLGLLRRQRHGDTKRWLGLVVAGAVAATLLPFVPSPFHQPAPWHSSPAALWWPVHLGLVLLAAGGLDDFLDHPLRRRGATAWTMMLAMLAGPAIYVLSDSARFLQVEAAVLLALSVLFASWRLLGILGFKTVVATAALAWLSIATINEQARAERTPTTALALGLGLDDVLFPMGGPIALLPAAPSVEIASTADQANRARLYFQGTTDAASPDGALLLDAPPPKDFMLHDDERAGFQVLGAGAGWSEYRLDMHQGQAAFVMPGRHAYGWRATLDGADHPVWRTRDGRRAVWVPRGQHHLRMDYRPLAFELGRHLVCAGLCLWILTGLVVLWTWYAQRRPGALGTTYC
jgi:hypothetical protein